MKIFYSFYFLLIIFLNNNKILSQSGNSYADQNVNELELQTTFSLYQYSAVFLHVKNVVRTINYTSLFFPQVDDFSELTVPGCK